MTPQDINNVVAVMRAAPLQNMAEAEQVSKLINELVEYFRKEFETTDEEAV